MQRFPRKITTAQLTTSAAVYYTCPANITTTISALTLCNTSTSAATTATVHLVPNGGTAGATNMILNARILGPNESYVVGPAIALDLSPGDTIQALASAANITLAGAVYETTA